MFENFQLIPLNENEICSHEARKIGILKTETGISSLKCE